MMMIHPAHALLLANQLHHARIARAGAYRRARLAAAVADCLVPVAPAGATKPCRPDPRRSAARPVGRHRSRDAAVHPGS